MKKIGIDLSPLQGPHRMRGIGYVTRHIINNLPRKDLEGYEIVLFSSNNSDQSGEEVVKSLNLKNIKHSLRLLPPKHRSIFEKRMPGRLALIPKAFMKLSTYMQYRFGTNSFGKTNDLDIFVQFDQSAPLPRSIKRGGVLALVIYDIIPYKLETDYLWGYKTARRNGFKRKAAIKCTIKRMLYKGHLVANVNHASKLISISEATSNDFVKHMGVKRSKLQTISLGADGEDVQQNKSNAEQQIVVSRYYDTSWGYLPRDFTITANSNFLLFVGGADPRRKLEDLVAAYNQLRSRGIEILLILSGDSMKGPKTIANAAVRKSLTETGYPEDIIYLGFTDNQTRDWLYKNATALVFPSVYEGFGLPVLEAMNYETPVISYDNLATKEVAKKGPLYANDVESLLIQLDRVLSMSSAKKTKLTKEAKKISMRYKWDASGSEFFEIIK